MQFLSETTKSVLNICSGQVERTLHTDSWLCHSGVVMTSSNQTLDQVQLLFAFRHVHPHC